MLDVPAVYGRQPPEPPAPVGHHAPAAVDQGAATGRADLLALLRIGTAEREDLVVAGLARRDARERLARHDGARLLLAGHAARGAELDAPLDSGADALGEGREERPRQVAQHEEHRREEERRPRLPSGEISELHRENLGPEALGRIEIGRDDLRRAACLAGPALARARVDLVDLQMISVRE